MKRAITIALSALAVAGVAGDLNLTRPASSTHQRTEASERCYYTDDTYVLNRKVLEHGHYCHPWL